jgi:hypothetical protein
MHQERQNINHDAYERLYRIKHVSNKNNSFKKTFSFINSLESKKDDSTHIYFSKDKKTKNTEIDKTNESNYYKINKDRNGEILNSFVSPTNEVSNKTNRNYLYKSRQKIIYDKYPSYQNQSHSQSRNNFNKSNYKFGSTLTTGFNYNNDSQLSYLLPNKEFPYKPKNIHGFQRSLSNFTVPKNSLYKNNDENIDKKEDDEDNVILSCSREESLRKTIKKLIDIKENCEHENKLMKGYQETPEEYESEDKKKKREPKFNSPITIYKKEIEMFKKVNPIEYEKELKKKLFDHKMLMKKLQNRKIYERIKIKK